jgi:hypothetical protein
VGSTRKKRNFETFFSPFRETLSSNAISADVLGCRDRG